MAKSKGTVSLCEAKEVLSQDREFLELVVQKGLQGILEEMDELVGAGRYERTYPRVGYRSGSYTRHLVTRVGKIELRVPQDRAGQFSTELFER